MSSAEAQLVTAMNRTINKATAPPVSSKAVAAKGADKPAETWAWVMLFGKVGKVGEYVRATAASPRVVANPNGIAYQARPPRI